MGRRRSLKLVAAALLAAPSLAHAVIFQGGVDPSANKQAPTGNLANSGWQWQYRYFGGTSATAVGPHQMLVAAHTGGAVNSVFFPSDDLGATTITAVNDYGTDLRLITVDKTFYSYAPLYETSTELNKYAVIYGRGGPRSSIEVHAGQNSGNPLLGYEWNTSSSAGPYSNGLHYWDGQLRWGQNKIIGTSANGGTLLNFDWTQNGDGTTGANEAAMVGGDSGGGLFIQDANGEWRIAAVNFSVDTYKYSPGGATLYGAMWNTTGLYNSNDSAASGAASNSYSSRVSSFIAQLNSVITFAPTWKVNADGNWSTAANWAHGTPANAAGATVDFRTTIQADRTVTLSATQTLGTLDFDNARRYTLTGGAITFDTSAANAQINVANGSHTIASPITLNKNVDLYVINPSSTLTLSGQMTATGRTINQTGPGTVEYKNVRASTLNIQSGTAKILSDGTSTGTSKVTTLTLPSTGLLDLTNNDLVITSGSVGTYAGNYNGLTGSIATGFNSGAWNGTTGIKSSTAAGTAMKTGLGIALASDALSFNSGTKSWSGQTVSPTDVLIKYTYVGDLDLDGKITGDDYFRIDQGYAAHATGYASGDVNFDGKINGDDYFWIDYNYVRQAQVVLAPPAPALNAGLSAVPEPAGLALITIATAFGIRRKRR